MQGSRDPLDRVDPNSAPRATWRDEVVGASGMNIVLGVWLMLSPWLLAYAPGDPAWSDFVAGALIAGIALFRVTRGLRDTWLSWINLALGLWVAVNGFLFAESMGAVINELIIGALVVMLAALSVGASDAAGRGKGARPAP